MGDVGMGFAYLCTCYCCGANANDPGPDGSRMGKAKKDPREQLIDKEFMKRDYKMDKDGRLHQNQPSSSSQMEIRAVQDSETGGGAPGKGDVGD
ncbi:hypothetical protein PM082_015409 [Marasmius tenuissimus]|nr:hypothetical protein PM082_015409 [Marasmius tenuissimus]